jgi:hypothetical protein
MRLTSVRMSVERYDRVSILVNLTRASRKGVCRATGRRRRDGQGSVGGFVSSLATSTWVLAANCLLRKGSGWDEPVELAINGQAPQRVSLNMVTDPERSSLKKCAFPVSGSAGDGRATLRSTSAVGQ